MSALISKSCQLLKSTPLEQSKHLNRVQVSIRNDLKANLFNVDGAFPTYVSSVHNSGN